MKKLNKYVCVEGDVLQYKKSKGIPGLLMFKRYELDDKFTNAWCMDSTGGDVLISMRDVDRIYVENVTHGT